MKQIKGYMMVHVPVLDQEDPYNGHEYVDLGLPSGTLWATMNLGANSIYDFGDEYKIGYVTPYDEQTQSSNFDYSGQDNTDPRLPLQNDAAHYAWGGAWSMPTYGQWEELKNNTTQTKEDGFIKVRGINGNELIFPYRSSNDFSLNNMLLNTIYSYGMSMYGTMFSQTVHNGEARNVFLNSGTSGVSFIHAAVRPVIG